MAFQTFRIFFSNRTIWTKLPGIENKKPQNSAVEQKFSKQLLVLGSKPKGKSAAVCQIQKNFRETQQFFVKFSEFLSSFFSFPVQFSIFPSNSAYFFRVQRILVKFSKMNLWIQHIFIKFNLHYLQSQKNFTISANPCQN